LSSLIEPFEAGYGRTLGNSLRRVLLSSLEGSAITSIQLEGAEHEFCALPGVTEDVTDIVLNLKKLLCKMYTREPRSIRTGKAQDAPGPHRAPPRATVEEMIIVVSLLLWPAAPVTGDPVRGSVRGSAGWAARWGCERRSVPRAGREDGHRWFGAATGRDGPSHCATILP